MKKLLSIFIVNALCLTAVMAQANVSDVRVELRDTLLNVTYNLEKDSNVELYYSSSNGAKYIGPLKELSGDCGAAVKAGKDRVAVWNPVVEIGYIEAPNSIIKVVAEALPEPEPVVEPEPKKERHEKRSMWMVGAGLLGSMADTPISLMYGHYRKFGWYIKLESDVSKQSTSAAYGLSNDFLGVSFKDDLRTDFVAGKLGLLWNINDKFVVNFGCGVQFDTMYLEADEDFGEYTNDEYKFLYIEYPHIDNEYKYKAGSSLSSWEQLLIVGEIGVTYNWRKLSVGINLSPNFNRFVGYEGMGVEEYSQSISNDGEYGDYSEWAKPIYKTKIITSLLIGINF
ncbi:MAG: hypothetical protein SNH88_07920 [Rikenellaceae bacterium]